LITSNKIGPLIVTRKDLFLEMDFPAYPMIPCQNPPKLLLQGLKQHPKKIFIIEEDPITGSIHCALVPYWTNQLKKSKIHACQASQRGGDLFCKLLEERVFIGGYAVKYMTGMICI